MADLPDALGLRRRRTVYDTLGAERYTEAVADVQQQAQVDADAELRSLSEPAKALRQGHLGLRSNLTAAGAIPDLLTGDNEEAQADLAEAEDLGLRAARYQPKISRVQDIHSPGDAAQLLVNTVAGQAANLGLTVAGAGVGGVLARYGLRAAGATAAQQAARIASGATKGAVATSYPQLAGENLQALNAEGTDVAPQQKALLAAGAAVPQTALDIMTPMKVWKNLGLGRVANQAVQNAVPPRLRAKLAKELASGALTEGSTELAQQAIQLGTRRLINQNLDVLSDESLMELVNSFALGAIAGGGFNTAATGVGHLFAEKGTIGRKYDELRAGREEAKFRESAGGAPLDIAAHRADDTLGVSDAEQLLDKALLDDSPLRNIKGLAAFLTEETNKAREPGAIEQIILETLQGQLKPGYKIEGLAGYFGQQAILDPDEQIDENSELEPVETSFEESSDPRAVSTVEPGQRRYYGDQRLVEDDEGGRQYAPTPLSEQLYQTASLSNRVQERKGSPKRFTDEQSAIGKNLDKMAVEQARREGKDDVSEVAARIGRVKGSERARDEARATGRDVNEVATELATKLTEGKPELQAILAEDGALKFLDHFESLSIEESPIDTPSGYSPKELAGQFLRERAPGMPPRRGDLHLTYKGKKRILDIKNLVFGQHKNRELTRDDERETDFNQRVADVVGEALSTLVNTPGVELDLRKIPDDTVVYARKGGVAITWGQIKNITKTKNITEEGGFQLPGEQETAQGEGIESVLPRKKLEPRKTPTEVGARTTVEPLLGQQTEQPEETIDRREGREATDEPRIVKILKGNRGQIEGRGVTSVSPEMLRTLVKRVAERFGLPEIRLLSRKDANTEIDKDAAAALAKDPSRRKEIAKKTAELKKAQGLAGGKVGTKTRWIYVDNALPPALWFEIMMHEVGHQIYRSTGINQATAGAVIKEFHTWLEERTGTKFDVFTGKKPPALLASMLNNANKKNTEGPADPGYDLSFEEYFADQVARWASSHEAPRTLAGKFFKGIAEKLKEAIEFIAKSFGFVDAKPATEVAKLLDALFDKTGLIEQTEAEILADARAATEVIGGKTLQEWADEKLSGQSPTIAAAAHLAPTSPQANVAVHQALVNELTDKELKILGRTFGSGPVRRKLLELIKQHVSGGGLVVNAIQRDVANTTNLVISYGYQFHKSGLLEVGPQTKTVLGGIEAMFAEAMGTVARHEKAQEILISMQQGIRRAQRGAGALFDVERNRGEEWNAHARKVVQGTIDVTNKLMTPITTVMTRLYDSGIPTLVTLGNRFAFRVGEGGQAENFVEAKNRRTTEFGKKFSGALKDLTADQRIKVAELLNSTTVARTKDLAVNAAVRRVREVLKELRDYATHPDRGGQSFMGEIKNYFPWVFDMGVLQKRRAEFEKLVGQDKYKEDLKKLKLSPVELFDYIIEQYGAADVELVRGPVPYARNINSRWLKFLHDKGDKKDQKLLASFFSKDIDTTLAVYTSQVVKRAEFAGILGKRGEKLGQVDEKGVWQDGPILLQARKEGASDKQIEATKKFVDAMMGSYGAAEFHPIIKSALGLSDKWFGTKWAEMNPKELRKLQGIMIVYQNLRVLAFATLSTLPDTAGLLLRGDLDSAFEGFRAGIRDAVALYKGDKTMLTELGETIGIIEQHAIQELLQQQYGSSYMPVFARKLNDKWFNAIGLTYYTKLMRLMALAAGKKFIANQVKKPGKHAERFLSELDLEKGDVQFDGDQLVINDKIKAALNRYVDQTIVRPNASQRPLWSSHPDFAILFHLKQFMFSMEEVILRRMAHEVANGNISPVVTAMAGYVVIGVLSDLVREELKYDEEDPQRSNYAFSDYVKSGARRAGLFGTSELLLDLQQERLYGGSGVKALSGPSFSQASELMDALVFGERGAWKTVLQTVPAAGLLLDHRLFDKRGPAHGEEEGLFPGP